MKVLQETQSICPICRKPLEAVYVSDEDKVFLRKTCEEHGEFESYIAGSEEDFKKWMAYSVINIPPKKAQTKGPDSQCPLHCGTCENHLQTACCVLIDVTERCNQHCPYCFAKAEYDECEEPDLAEIERKYDLLLDLGEERPFNIQLSGGEPTVREDLPEIIRMGRDKGFEFIQINTNGRRLALEEGYAKILKAAGATVIFLQFDGTNDQIYEVLRGEPLLEIKKRVIANCRKAGLPVTLVPTVVKDVNYNNIGSMMDVLLDNVDVVKGIHFQPVSFFGRYPDTLSTDGTKHVDYENRVTMFDVMHELETQTNGKFKYEDLYPITTGHTLCCFTSTYLKRSSGKVTCLTTPEAKAAGASCCSSTPDPLEVIKKDRDFVLNKWDIPEQEEECNCSEKEADCCGDPASTCCGDSELMDFDQFLLEYKRGMFSVSCMAFQDISNLDAERLKRCRVQVLSPDDRLIPFCAYQSIYRKKYTESISNGGKV